MSGQVVTARFTGPLPSKCTLTFAQSFAELSRKYPHPQAPANSRGRIRGTASTRGLGVWPSQSFAFGSLAAAFGACFLRFQKATLGSTSSRCKDALQDHGCRSLTFGSWAATYEGKDKCAVPFSSRTRERQEVVALSKL